MFRLGPFGIIRTCRVNIAMGFEVRLTLDVLAF